MQMDRSVVLVALCSVILVPSVLQARAGDAGISLDAALDAALTGSPELTRVAAEVEEARGRLVVARTYSYNPRLAVEGAERSGPGGATTDRALALSQQIELAGKRGKRRAEARAALAAAEARAARARRAVRAAVTRTFTETILARDLLAVARADVDLTRSLLSLEERRLEAGAGTRIEVNLARAAAGRSVRRFEEANAAWSEARARLAEAMGADPETSPRVVGELPIDQPSGAERLPELGELIRRALAERADLAALRREGDRAERRVTLERARAIPDLELGAFASREEGDDVVGLSAGVAIPLFDRNRGAIAEAVATVERRRAAVLAAELAVRREVTAAFGHYRAAARAVEALRGLVIDTLEESLDLLRKAVEAGELSTTDVLVLRRELVEGRREQVEAAGELWIARTELELAAGGALATTPAEERRGGER